MKLRELKLILDVYADYPRTLDAEVMVYIKQPNSIGPSPAVKVKNAQMGFDWDSGRLLIACEQDLMVADNDLINRVRKAEEKYGWADYDLGGLEAQVKRLTKRIKELEDERTN
jgi:hypothetical protein